MARPVGATPFAKRRPAPRVWLALLLLGALAELIVLILVGQAVGGWVVLLLLLAGLAGMLVMRAGGRRTVAALNTTVNSGQEQSRQMADGTLITVAGILLLIPGFLSDAAALLLIFPLTRPLARRGLERGMRGQLRAASAAMGGRPGARMPFGAQTVPGTATDARDASPQDSAPQDAPAAPSTAGTAEPSSQPRHPAAPAPVAGPKPSRDTVTGTVINR